MMDIRNGRLVWDGRPITETLPTPLVMLITDWIDQAQAALDEKSDPSYPDVWECILDPDGNLHQLPPEKLRIDPPDGWHHVNVIKDGKY